MHIGIDFDNTIICYDELFHKAATERGLIEEAFAKDKNLIRNHLRNEGAEDDWTEMQGFVYSRAIEEAKAYDGVLDFLRFCSAKGIVTSVVSHKTRYPYLGPKFDLHEAAREWLGRNILCVEDAGIDPERIFFEATTAGKIERIKKIGCNYFIDDLPEFLSDIKFPSDVKGILFDPKGNYTGDALNSFASWGEIKTEIEKCAGFCWKKV